MGTRGVEDSGRESTKQGSMGTHRNEAANMGPPWVYIRPSTYMLWLLVWCFMGTLDRRSGVSLTFCLVSGHYPSY